jgi:peptidyl-prolyl cis-trans isomerase SurA
MPQIQTRIRMDERALMVRESFINKTRKEYKLTSQTDSEVLEYANANLEKKYPEFGFLMQEYRDGILLFNISKDQIWDKASKDEAKLKEIYEKGNFDKPYNKVRGIVISKYQDELEKEWIKALREKYTIKVNQDILKSIK